MSAERGQMRAGAVQGIIEIQLGDRASRPVRHAAFGVDRQQQRRAVELLYDSRRRDADYALVPVRGAQHKTATGRPLLQRGLRLRARFTQNSLFNPLPLGVQTVELPRQLSAACRIISE